MKKVFNVGLLFALLVFSANTASAQQVIAYADVDSIVVNMKEYNAARSEIQAYGQQKQKLLQAKEQQIAAYVEQVKAKLNDLSVNQQKEEEAKVQKMQQDLQNSARNAEGELAQKEAEKMQVIYDKFNAAIEAVAKEKGYTYILDKKVFLFLKGGIDATADVKAKLGVK